MIKNKRILTIITARKGSKGLKDKNVRKINGKELFLWPVNAAVKSKYIDLVTISTDSEKIINISKKKNIFIPFKRPNKLSGDKSSSINTVIHMINFLKKKKLFFDYVVILEPTSPLTTTYDLDKAIELIVKNRADSLISLYHTSRYHHSFHYKFSKNKRVKSIFNVKKNKRRQDLDKTYFMDGSLYICDVNFLLKNKLIVGNNTVGFITSKVKSFEIDDFIDYEIIKFLKKNEKKF